MTKGFIKDNKFHPTEKKTQRMTKDVEIGLLAKNNGETIAVSTGPDDAGGIDAFQVKTLSIVPSKEEWEKMQKESKENSEKKKNEAYVEEKRLDFVKEKIRDLERKHGDESILGVKPLSKEETKEYIELLIDEQDGKKINKHRLESLENRIPYNTMEELRSIQHDNGLSRDNFIDEKHYQKNKK